MINLTETFGEAALIPHPNLIQGTYLRKVGERCRYMQFITLDHKIIIFSLLIVDNPRNTWLNIPALGMKGYMDEMGFGYFCEFWRNLEHLMLEKAGVNQETWTTTTIESPHRVFYKERSSFKGMGQKWLTGPRVTRIAGTDEFLTIRNHTYTKHIGCKILGGPYAIISKGKRR